MSRENKFKRWNPPQPSSLGAAPAHRGSAKRARAGGATDRQRQVWVRRGNCQAGPQAVGQRGIGRAAGGCLRGADFLAGGTEPGRRGAGAAGAGGGAPSHIPRPAAGSGGDAGSARRRGRGIAGTAGGRLAPGGEARRYRGPDSRRRGRSGADRAVRGAAAGASLAGGGRRGGSRAGGGHQRAGGGGVAGLARNLAAKPAGAVEDADPRHPGVLRQRGRAVREVPGGCGARRGGRATGSGGAGADGAEADAHAGGRGAGEAGGRGIHGVARHAGRTWTRRCDKKNHGLALQEIGQSGRPCATRLAPTCWSGSSNTSRSAP